MADRPYLQLMRALEAGGVDYAVAGGFAVVLHGVPRMTFDLDIVVDDDAANMRRLVLVLEQEGFRPRLPLAMSELANESARRLWLEERNPIAFTVTHPTRVMEEVDVLLGAPVSWFEVDASRIFREIEGVRVPIIGRRLLRRMKLATGREKDRSDAELLGDDDD